jgi:hypothetical protein
VYLGRPTAQVLRTSGKERGLHNPAARLLRTHGKELDLKWEAAACEAVVFAVRGQEGH